MKEKMIKLLPLALLLGLVISLVFTGHEGWKQQGNCSTNMPAAVSRVDCSTIDSGVPLKFLHSTSTVDLTSSTASQSSPVMLGVSSAPTIDVSKLVLDTAIWSVVSLLVLLGVDTRLKAKK